MQAEGKRKLEGKPPRIKGVGQAFREIYAIGGIRGLWRGAVVNCQRAALVNLGGKFEKKTSNLKLLNLVIRINLLF